MALHQVGTRKLLDEGQLEQIGINPKTGLPIKLGAALPCSLKENVLTQLRIVDEQDAVNRYRWSNLPNGYTGQDLERLIYYRFSVMLFYNDVQDKLYFLPFVPVGNIDITGRHNYFQPIPMGSNMTEDGGKSKAKTLETYKLKLVRSFQDLEDKNELMSKGASLFDKCVILADYTPQANTEYGLSRANIQEAILSHMSEVLPFARTNFIANSGIKQINVSTISDENYVNDLSKTILTKALSGEVMSGVYTTTEAKELTGSNALDAQTYLLYLQGLDNYRLSLYGLGSGGLFQKKSHMLEAEQQMNIGTASLVYKDGLERRQRFCDLANALFGLGIWCDASEEVLGMDTDGDGEATDSNYMEDGNEQVSGGDSDVA